MKDLFRTVKSEGLNDESGEPETGKALRKLFIMALPVAIRILQLHQVRSGEKQTKDVIGFFGGTENVHG